jgi:hypothetical protein
MPPSSGCSKSLSQSTKSYSRWPYSPSCKICHLYVPTYCFLMRDTCRYKSRLFKPQVNPERITYYQNQIVSYARTRYNLVTHFCQNLNLFSLALQSSAGYGLLVRKVFVITNNDAPHRYKSSGRVISSSQRPIADNSQHSQQANIHVAGDPTNESSRRAAADLRLRPRGHWDRREM